MPNEFPPGPSIVLVVFVVFVIILTLSSFFINKKNFILRGKADLDETTGITKINHWNYKD